MKKKVLFLDRDGVIIRMVKHGESSYDSAYKEEDVALVTGIVPLLRFCNEHDILVLEITNQPGVAKQKISLTSLNAIEEKVHKILNEEGVFVNQVYKCLHHPEAEDKTYCMTCDCRKPSPGLLLQAAKEHDLDLGNSLFLGDNASDVQAAEQAGCIPILFFHEDDEPHKIEAKKSITTKYCIRNLSEALPIIQQHFT